MTKRRVDRRYLYLIMILALAAGIIGFIKARDARTGLAADASKFNPGDIISDEQMGDYLSMSEADIYNFMKSKNSCNDTNIVKASWYPNLSYHIENGHFVCLADEKFDGESSAHIIWQAAQDYQINPKVLIVLLEKEQGLITDTWPNSTLQYRSATGYGCPDTAACDSQYYGFKNQIRNAAKFYRKNLDGDPNWTNYPVGVNNVLYNPNYACGSSPVDIKNRATGALYTYTPYQPNSAALRSGYGMGDGCSAYGNRNFYLYYTDWFGDTHASSDLSRAITGIKKAYEKNSSVLGNAVGNIDSNPATGIYWQQYEHGFIVGSSKTNYYVSMGKIRDSWITLGLEAGKLGFPIGDIESNPATGISWQQYEHGFIVGNDKTGYFISEGKIREAWIEAGLENGSLGFPIENIDSNPTTGIYWQQYEHGFIVGKDSTGYYVSMGKIRDVWAKQGCEGGQLGFPLSNIKSNPTTGIYWQQYEHGFIVGKDSTGYYISEGKIRDVWAAQGCESGELGFPVGDIETNPATGIYWQQYERGFVVGRDSTGYYISIGKIREIWAEQGFEGGRLGFPTGGIVYHADTGIHTQNYEHGVILFNARASQTGIIFY